MKMCYGVKQMTSLCGDIIVRESQEISFIVAFSVEKFQEN